MASGQAEMNFFALALQAAFGTAISDTSVFKYFPVRSIAFKENKPSKPSDQLWGSEPQWMRKQNNQDELTVSMDCYYEGLAMMFYRMFQRSSSTEVASYVITSANDVINFKEDGGGTLNADVADGSYTTTTYAAAIKTALEAAGAGTYTVTYSTSTKKFTVAVSGGASAVQFLGTGDGESFLGFTAASANAASITADTARGAVYDHIFIPVRSNRFLSAQDMDKGLTMLCNMDLVTQQADTAFQNSLGFIWGENDPHAPNITAGFKARYLQEIAAISLPSGVLNDTPGNPDGNFDMDITVGGQTYLNHYAKQIALNLTSATDFRFSIGNTKPVKAIKTGKHGGTLSFGWDFEDDTTLRTYIAAAWEDKSATASITLHQDGETIRGSIKQGWTFEMPACRPTGDTAAPATGTIEQPYMFALERDTTNDAAMITITLRNQEYLA